MWAARLIYKKIVFFYVALHRSNENVKMHNQRIRFIGLVTNRERGSEARLYIKLLNERQMNEWVK